VTRRQWIFAAAGGGAISASGSGLYATRVEPKWFDISQTPIYIPKLEHSFRALHLADLHSSTTVPTPLLLQAVKSGIRTRPDVIFLTGDYVSTLRAYDERGLLDIFRRLAKAAPTFAVMGNHDCIGAKGSTEHLRQMLSASGVNVLQNASSIIELRGQRIQVAGTADLWNDGEFDPYAAFVGVSGNLPTVALVHNPDGKKAISNYPWDVMLSGHTHGGQVVFPLIHPYWLPTRDQRFIAGLYGWQDRQIYITRGVGSPSGIRFRARPEVSVLDFRPGPAAPLTIPT
jgi:predicted MPP superfamily phosphohydrolase